jgi:thiamine kinase-like enzyme
VTVGRIAALPCWRGPPRAEVLKGGLSNEIWKVTDDAGAHVVRFGRDYPFHHVFRDREAMVTRAAHAAGFAPAVEYTAPGIMVTAFVTSHTWGPSDVCEAPDRVGRLLRDFHDRMGAQVSGPAFLFWPAHVIRDYLRQLGPAFDQWQALNSALEETHPPLPIIFGHNDLLPANFLDDGDRLWLIDYEYAGFGTCLFDLAGAASNAGMDRVQSMALLTAYLGQTPDAGFTRAFDAMQVTSLLREMLWAHVSALHLHAPGVDYAAYAADNRARLMTALDQYQTLHGKIT